MHNEPLSMRRCLHTHYATPSPLICSTTAPTYGWCNCYLGIATSLPLKSIPTSPANACVNCMPATTQGAKHDDNIPCYPNTCNPMADTAQATVYAAHI